MPAKATSYADVKTVLEGNDDAARIRLARDPATPPEVLYFLAEHAEVHVRRVVAENPSTPTQADAILSRDADVSVRCALARKAVGDGLDDAARRNLWRMGFTVLETLMHDQAVRVRRALTEALCSRADAPRGIIVGLARDSEEIVAAPVLRESPVLNDDDMIAILNDGAPDWARNAMAERETVSPALSGAISDGASTRTLSCIVANPNAIIDEPVMERIVERSRDAPDLQKPLVTRPGLTAKVLVELARVVAAPLLGVLKKRPDIDPDTARLMNEAIESRDGDPHPVRTGRANKRAGTGNDAAEQSEDAIALALSSGESELVVESLARRAGFPVDTVRRMIASKSARTVVSLAWKAGLGARFALDLQRQLAHIPPAKLINARNGTDYALDPAEMKEQLSYFA